jgi:hypothetical protein
MRANGVVDGALREIVAEARRKDPQALAVAVHIPGWHGKPTLALEGGEQVPVHWCRSVLELRERLVEADERPVVLVTDRDEGELGEDVLCRLARGRLLRVGLWEPIKAHFRASMVPPRVVRMEWLPDALLRHQPGGGYPPAPNGVLTEEHALSCLCEELIGNRAPTGLDLLRAVAEPAQAATLAGEPEPMIEGLSEHLESRIGPIAPTLLAAVRAGHGAHAVALGLAARVTFGGDERTLTEAAVRLERFVGGRRIGHEAGLAWADASERLLAEADPELARVWERDAERLLADLGVGERAELSDALAAGLAGRLEAAARALGAWLETGEGAARRAALASLEPVERHRHVDRKRLDGLRMAARLIQFLHEGEDDAAASLADAARLHLAEGGLIDRAREALDGDEKSEPLRALYGDLATAVDRRRERRARRFGELLAAATAADRDDGLLTVERVVPEVVRPVARAAHVLLVVLDGMAEATFRSLSPTLDAAGWRRVEAAGAGRTPVLSVLPSITRLSRTSLLSGRLTEGGQGDEAAGLRDALRDVGEARVFHKADVASGGELREAIANPAIRVVAVVVNAIDDRLAKGEQIDVAWTIDSIRPLRFLLDAASEASRAVVLASDHGHVLERGGEHRSHSDGGARWRPAGGDAPGEGEVLLRGRRVRDGGGAIIAPAIEQLRYRPRCSGYHGGATPQEVVAPLVIYVPGSMELDGFADAPPDLPEWWELGYAESSAGAPSRPAPAPRRAAPAPGQQPLFAPAVPDRSAWIEALLGSEVYRSQRQRAHRPPDDARVADLLAELELRGWVAPESTVATALGVAPLRVRPLVASIQQLLNVDGYRVLALDAATSDVRLDRALLDAQFQL